jgi:hypothetical protein
MTMVTGTIEKKSSATVPNEVTVALGMRRPDVSKIGILLRSAAQEALRFALGFV